ncbi:MAG: hypothetical protein CL889_01900 [Dehalococcoidia bacterium]|nr:hypothetical protein [Dehalococcoidia bacterium]
MLLAGFDILLTQPGYFLLWLIPIIAALVISISVHEFSHAYAAFWLGDQTAKNHGRLTLNPLRHLEPVGSILILLIGFGWGRPVPVNPSLVKSGRRGLALIAAAGPASNIFFALFIAIFFQLGFLDVQTYHFSSWTQFLALGYVAIFFQHLLTLNLILAVFNLLPMAPLDGSGVLRGIVPEGWLPFISRIETYGPVLLFGVFMLQFFIGARILGYLFDPVLNLANKLVG